MRYDEIITAVGERVGLPRDEAEAVTHAVLRTMSERLTGGEAEDLRAQLPRRRGTVVGGRPATPLDAPAR